MTTQQYQPAPPPRPTIKPDGQPPRADQDEDSVYNPDTVHGTVGAWSYIVFHDKAQPMKPKPQIGFHA